MRFYLGLALSPLLLFGVVTLHRVARRQNAADDTSQTSPPAASAPVLAPAETTADDDWLGPPSIPNGDEVMPIRRALVDEYNALQRIAVLVADGMQPRVACDLVLCQGPTT